MRKRLFSLVLGCCTSILFAHAGVKPCSMAISAAFCEGKAAPMGVPLSGIQFGWKLTSLQKNVVQTAYQLVVGSSLEKVDAGAYDVWNSGKIARSASIGVKYSGLTMQPGTTYYWRVRVWDKEGQISEWSKPAKFTTGLFAQPDWSGAKWIGYEDMADSARVIPGLHFPEADRLGGRNKRTSVVPYFRKVFTAHTHKKIQSATVFVTGLGQYEMNINGLKVGNSFLSPGWTDYDKRCLYNVYDVTALMKKDDNVLGLTVGNGFYNISRQRYYKFTNAYGYPKLICLLKLVYEDGTTQTVVSDSSWRTSPSPVLFSSIYGGEDFDATKDQAGWTHSEYNDAGWKNALVVKAPRGKLLPEIDFPLAVADSLPVRHIDKIDSTTWLYDFGQNSSGIVELRVKGHRGDTVKITPCELVDDDKRANQRASGEPYYFTYILNGRGEEVWRPQFTYYGFRYVMVEHAVPAGSAASTISQPLPVVTMITSLHTRNATPPVGTFHCSNELFNRVNELIRWAIKSNMQSVITDCPHREKLGWLEQDYLMGTSIQYNYNIDLLYKSIVRDMMDAQLDNGLVPDIAPEYVQFQGGFRDSPEWGSASVILPWMLYKWYGDLETLDSAYGMMTKYIAYLENKAQGQLLNYGLGDWYDYGPGFPGEAQLTPKSLTATAVYYYDVAIMAQVAKITHHVKDANHYLQQAIAIQTAFNNKFFDSAKKIYSTGSQTAMSMPLSVGLVSPAQSKAVVANMIDSIRKGGYKLTAGDIGFHFLIRALSDNHEDATIYAMNDRTDVPGYGYQLEKGATALTESWPALKEVSNNHLMLGHIMEWFYGGIGGIGQAEGSTAYKHIIIAPALIQGLTSADVSYESPYGTIRSQWHKEGQHVRLHVEIPVNTSATIHFPSSKNKPRRVGSGVYDFDVHL